MVPQAGCVQKRERMDERLREREGGGESCKNQMPYFLVVLDVLHPRCFHMRGFSESGGLMRSSICAVIDHPSHMHETCCEIISWSMLTLKLHERVLSPETALTQ